MPPDELDALKQTSEGLLYPSESDEPFEPFRWPAAAGGAREQVAAHVTAGRTIDQVPVEKFFAELEASDDGPRYRQLRNVLESALSEAAVFRAGVGEVKVDVYLLGKARSGDWVGLHTTSVET